MTEQNNVDPEYEGGETAEAGINDKDVKDFLEYFQKCSTQIPRTEKITDIEEDYEQLESLSDRLPDYDRPQMKSSLYYKILRTYDQQAIKFPKISADGDKKNLAILSAVEAKKDDVFTSSGVDEVWKDVLNGFKAEGTVMVQTGYNGEEVTAEKCDLAELFFDSTMETIANSSARKGKTIKTIIRAIEITYGEFISLFPEWEGKIVPGSPQNSIDESRDVWNVTDDAKQITSETRIGLHYAYSIQRDGNPIFMIYAGGQATIISKQEGKDYPFKRKVKGKKKAYLPFIDFHFSTVKRGFYSVSIIGMMKDGARAYEKILNLSLPFFSKSVNPIMMLLGGVDERAQERLQMASEMQDLGVSSMVPVPEGVKIELLKPDSIFQEFEAARTVVFRDLAMRYDINLQAMEEQEQTATEFVGKTKTEIKAISGLYTTNKFAFDLLALYLYTLSMEFGKTDKKEKTEISLDDEGGVLELDEDVLIDLIKDWDGVFCTETDLRLPVSQADKSKAITEMENSIFSTFYGRAFFSVDEIRLELDSLYNKAIMWDLDELYSMDKLIAKASAMLQSRQAQQVQQAPTGGAGENGGQPQNEDVAAELAPQTFLADQ